MAKLSICSFSHRCMARNDTLKYLAISCCIILQATRADTKSFMLHMTDESHLYMSESVNMPILSFYF